LPGGNFIIVSAVARFVNLRRTAVGDFPKRPRIIRDLTDRRGTRTIVRHRVGVEPR
jgi:hypothetical protein